MNPLRALDVELKGLQLIEASAGTGKTFAITTLALRGVVEAGLDIGKILVVTFTNAATAELRNRLRARLRRALDAYVDPASAEDDDEVRELVRRRKEAGLADADMRRLRQALDGFDEAAIFTIHGFCQRVLRELAFESGAPFDAELIGDPSALLRDAVRDVWTTALFAAPPAVPGRLAQCKITPRVVTDIAATFAQHRELSVVASKSPAGDAASEWVANFVREAGPRALEALARRKAAGNLQDYNDLLHQVASALRGESADLLAAGIRRRYGLALVDEFQDTDPVQFEIFRAVHRRTGLPLFLIGDPKQAIYAFRGADVYAYLKAQREAGVCHTLLTNWRSSPRLVCAVNALFSTAEDTFVIDKIRFRPGKAAKRNRDDLGGTAAGQAPLRIAFARRDAQRLPETKGMSKVWGSDHWLLRAMADTVVGLLEDGATIAGHAIRPGDMAVLCRSNAQLALVGEALRAAGVPSVAMSEASVFDSPEAGMLEVLLRALADPADARALRAALVTPLIGLGAAALLDVNAKEAEWDRWVESFVKAGERWRASGVTAALRALFEEQGVPQRVLGWPGGERSLTNLLHLGELLQQAASEGRRGPRGLADWLRRQRVASDLGDTLGGEATQIRLEGDAHAVSLVTVHKAKGLEYPVVLCPFLWDVPMRARKDAWPRFHDADGRLTIDLSVESAPASDNVTLAAQEVIAEDVRSLYVAVTRARQLCVLFWGAFNDFEESALARTLHRYPGRNKAAPAREAKEIKALSDDELAADLVAFAKAARGSIAVDALRPPGGRGHQAARADGAALVPPPEVPAIEQRWRVGSFTSLSAGAQMLGTRGEEEGRDRDEVATELVAAGAAPAALQGFPRGRAPGTLVHRILEHLEFDGSEAAQREVVAREVGVSRLGAEWVDPLARALRDALATPLLAGDAPPRLCDVPRARRLVEMEFAFPVARGPGRAPLSATALADVFARHGGSEELVGYAERLRRLPFQPLTGFLRGYIDCVFAHADCWYVADYKTNDLGPTAAAYAPAALAVEMVRHDYVLQAHLYLVALHRYLTRRLPGYDYARDCGGALYLFLRGMAPARGPATGVVNLLPPPALIAALSEVLAG